MPTPQPEKTAPPLVRFLVKNAAIGFALAGVFVAAMLTFNVGNMATLVTQSDIGIFAVALMTFMIGLTFASIQMGFAVMFSYENIGTPPTKRNDPLMSTDDMQRLGLKPIPVRNRSR
jgi:hypothetical protein